MSLRNDQYDWRGTRTGWRKWKRALKRGTARKFRRKAKNIDAELPERTRGWAS